MQTATHEPDTIYTSLSGVGLLSSPIFNKGTAFTERERDEFHLHGLLPPQVGTLEQQVARRMLAFRALTDDFSRWVWMRDLQDVNETLFYALMTRHVEEMLPIVYTPTVGEGCQRFSEVWRKPRGLFLSYPNKDRIAQILSHPRYDGVRCIVVSDGERILGLGDQGAGGMGIPIGKLALYTALAGVHPLVCLPVMLDVGTDNAERLNNPLYLGWKHERVRGPQYDEFVETFVRVVRRRWPHVLLQWEDFAGANAGRLLARYRDQICSFNDDIQGTAAVATATILSAVNVTGVPLTEQRIAIVGFGSAGLGIANLLVAAMVKRGMSEAEARSRFYAIDRAGLLVKGETAVRPEQAPFARSASEVAGFARGLDGGIWLEHVMESARPTVLIGVSAQRGAFTETAVRTMAAHTARPVIFPLSNPTSCAEATPEDLLRWTDGRAIVGTGSPFAPVEINGRQIAIAQTNNSYIFPGLALGVISAKAKRVSDTMCMAAAEALAALSPTAADPGPHSTAALLPPMDSIRSVSLHVARAVGRQAEEEGLAQIKGAAFERTLQSNIWEPVYRNYRMRRDERTR